MSVSGGGFEWPVIATEDYLLLGALPPLLACMAYFSLVEATYFSLTPADRLGLRRTHPEAARRIEAILSTPRVLLVSDMLGALVVSTTYLVVSTVLVSRFEHSLLFSIAIAVISVLGMVLSAEVLPKIIGTTDRSRAARVTARSTAIFCTVMGPLARGIDRFVLAPIGRLTAQIQPTGVVDAAELAALLEQSAREGSIDVREREAIEGVMRLRRLRVRDVMTPRVDMAFVYVDSDDSEIVATSTRARLTHLPVVGRHVDEVVGILSLKRYLLTTPRPTRAECMEPPRFVPELASLEQLLEHFRRSGSKLAIAVDEYGGTAGIVALEDCVEEIVGDIADVGEIAVDAPLEVAAGVWRVSGEMSVARWSEIFGARAVSARSSTVAGIVLQRLSRLARAGDKVDLANVRIEVEKVEGARIRSVLVSLKREVA